MGIEEVKTGVGGHGVVALVRGKKAGPTVALRADMDALPILEETEAPYKSQNPGVKHACGHDLHMTVELGVAEVLSKMRDQISGTIKFVFQPAEECPPGGALDVIGSGALRGAPKTYGKDSEYSLQGSDIHVCAVQTVRWHGGRVQLDP